MNLADIQIFAKVVEDQSFSSAANKLGVTKGAVSKGIVRLERALGIRLLQRTTRKLSLTEAGAKFFQRVNPALSTIDDSWKFMSGFKREPSGRLRVTAPVTFGRMHVVPRIPEFLRRYPEVAVDMVLTDRVVNVTAEGFDVAIRQSARLHLGLVAKKLVATRRVLVASPSYLKKHGTPRSVHELKNHQCLSYLQFTSKPKWRFKSSGKLIQVAVNSRFHINNIEAIHQLVLDGMGIAIMPTFMAGPDIKAGRLVKIISGLEILSDLGSHVHVVYAQDHQRLPKVTAFLGFFAEQFAGTPEWD
jgi:DNA-binding transcriptional LysR family regulator